MDGLIRQKDAEATCCYITSSSSSVGERCWRRRGSCSCSSDRRRHKCHHHSLIKHLPNRRFRRTPVLRAVFHLLRPDPCQPDQGIGDGRDRSDRAGGFTAAGDAPRRADSTPASGRRVQGERCPAGNSVDADVWVLRYERVSVYN